MKVDFADLLVMVGGLLMMGSTWWLLGVAGVVWLVGACAVAGGIVLELRK